MTSAQPFGASRTPIRSSADPTLPRRLRTSASRELVRPFEVPCGIRGAGVCKPRSFFLPLFSQVPGKSNSQNLISTILEREVYLQIDAFLEVEPRGFEPLTSAVRSQSKICRRLPYSVRNTLGQAVI